MQPADEWSHVRRVFEDALRLPAGERARFVSDASPDARIAERVTALIDAYGHTDRFLEGVATLPPGPPGDDRSGTRLGPYHLLARIGSGGMGDVYRARDSRLDRTVAIKVLRANATGAQQVRQRLEREARAVGALKHPHICTLHDIGTTETASGESEVHYLVMEYLDGNTLADVLAQGPLSPEIAVEYAVQVASALRVAHAGGIVHRDLKPGNIMVTATGATLLDFGIAKAVEVAAGPAGVLPAASRDNVRTTLVGTPSYMAPELLRGAPSNARTDVYALGCVLFEMLTGRRLFPDDGVATDPERRPGVQSARLPPSVPDELQRIVTRCLAPDPEGRYQTADGLLQDLRRVASGPDRIASGPPAPAGRRRRVLVMTGAAILVLGAAAYTLGIRSLPSNTPPAAASSVSVPQLAVVPLRTIGAASPGDEHLGVAIADSIITRLAPVRGIGLRPTTAVIGYAEVQPDPQRMAAELDVEYLLTGAIQRSPSTYRVTFQLVRAPEGTVTWARTYDMVRSGLRDVQDSVAEQVVDAIRLRIDRGVRNSLRAEYTESEGAYELYLKGRASLLNYTEAGMKAAIAAFEQAVAIDPDYARARAGLALATAWFSIRYAYEPDALEWGARAESAARAALAADPRLAEARLAIAGAAGTVHGRFEWAAVIDEASRALEMDPTLELAHVVLMRAYFHFGLFDRMAREAAAARRLNPLGNVEVARLEVAGSLFSGEHQRARDQAAALLARSDAPVIRNYLGLAQFYTGDVDGARRTLAAIERGGRPDVRAQAALASVEAAAGDRDAARARIRRIEQGPYMDHHVAYSLASAHAQLGNVTAAIRWLQEAADTGFPCFPSVERDPLLNPLRQTPEFTALLPQFRQRFERDTARFDQPRERRRAAAGP